MIDSIKNLKDACDKVTKELSALDGNKSNDEKYLKGLRADIDTAKKELDSISKSKETILKQTEFEQAGIIKRIADKEVALDLDRKAFTQDRNKLDEDKANFEKTRLSLLAENDKLKSEALDVQKMRLDLESKLAKHREAVESLRS